MVSLAHWLSSPAPPSLLGATSEVMAVEDSISASSLARTDTSTPAFTVLLSIAAVADPATLVLATTTPLLVPAAPKRAAGADVAALPTPEWTRAALTAETRIEPLASNVEPETVASVLAGSIPLKAWPSTGPPRMASSPAKKRFVASHPMVVSATTTPTESAPEMAAALVIASICVRFAASTAMSPPVAVRVALVAVAVRWLRIRLVAMEAATAIEVPTPLKELPPDDDDVESTVARTSPCPRARTPTDAPVTYEFVIDAVTRLRRSLRTTAPPRPMESEFVTLKFSGRGVASGTGFHQPRSA